MAGESAVPWSSVIFFVTFSLLLSKCVFANQYKRGDKVELYVNKVGPYFNPHETYHYYQLPVCHPEKIEHKSLTLGEVLDGDRMAKSNYEIKFLEDVEMKELCGLSLAEKELSRLKEAIEDLYYFELILDDIPIRGFVGHLEESGFLPHRHNIYLNTHLHFTVEYNGDQVIYANVSSKENDNVNVVYATAPYKVLHTYSVRWVPTDVTFADRDKKLRSNEFFPRSLEISELADRFLGFEREQWIILPQVIFVMLSFIHILVQQIFWQYIVFPRHWKFLPRLIHWLSIINSMVLVFLLIGFVVIILMRVLKNDFARYNVGEDDVEDMDGDEYGWKIIHTDVFRFPRHKNLFCAILGVGAQFLAIAFGIITMALLGMFNVHRHGAMNSTACFLYAVTSGIAGFVAANMFRQMGGKNWVHNINLTSCLFSLPFFVVWSIQNAVAWAYQSTQALPFTTIVLLGCVWLLIGYPLTILGGIFGKNTGGDFDAPCRTKNISREIPKVHWYRSTVAHCAIGGFLPFSAVSVELYYIFATLWGREQYTLYGILLVVFVILLSVTACISIALTYFQLSAEDYRWWWRSMASAGSSCFFVFLYSVFYYYKRSNMYGVLQSLEFFTWTLLMCYIFFLTLGTVAFFASLKFVRYMYGSIKMD